MIRFRTLLPLLFVLCAATLSGCASSRSAHPNEWDGLVLQPGTRLGAVFVKPDAEIASYTSVFLDPVEVSFARNWDPNRGGRSQVAPLDADDVTAMKVGLADMFRETFRAELARGGYQLVDEIGPDTLRVTASIVDLFVTAPNTPTPGARTYTTNTGRMTLVAELRDSVTGEILARVVDTQGGRSSGSWQAASSVTNSADARRAIRVWASALRRGLDGVSGRAN
jgi:hypothetical protein